MIIREAIKTLTDEISALAMRHADEWVENGVLHADVRAALMTAAVHGAARIAMTVASDDANPKDFIRNAAPHMARQITEYAVPAMDAYVSALKAQKRGG